MAPSLIPKRAGDRVKTDRRDAASLARLHRAGELTAVWVADAGHEAMRDLVRARLDAVHALRRARQQLSGFLLRQGFANPRQLMAYLGLVPSEHSSGTSIKRGGLTKAMPRIVCSAFTTGASVQFGSIASICAVSPVAPSLGGFDRRDVVLEHDMMHRLLELEPRQPAAMQLGPCRPPVATATTIPSL